MRRIPLWGAFCALAAFVVLVSQHSEIARDQQATFILYVYSCILLRHEVTSVGLQSDSPTASHLIASFSHSSALATSSRSSGRHTPRLCIVCCFTYSASFCSATNFLSFSHVYQPNVHLIIVVECQSRQRLFCEWWLYLLPSRHKHAAWCKWHDILTNEN